MKNKCFGTLYLFELKKILKSKVAVITFFILLIVGFINVESEMGDNADIYAQNELGKIEGRTIDDALIKEMVDNPEDENESPHTYRNLNRWVAWIWGTVIPEDLTVYKLSQVRDSVIEQYMLDEKLSEGELQYWKEKSDVDFPGVWHDNMDAKGYIHATSNLFLFAILFLLPMGVAVVFAMEYQHKTDPLIRASKFGDKRTYYAKMLAGITYAVVSMSLVIGIALTYMAIRYGTDCLGVSALLVDSFLLIDMTAKELLIRMVMIMIASCVMLSTMTMFLSQTFKNAFAVLGAMFGFWFLCALLNAVVKFRPLSQFISSLPYMVVATDIGKEYRLVNIFGRYFTIFEYAPVMYILLGILFLTLGRIIYGRQER